MSFRRTALRAFSVAAPALCLPALCLPAMAAPGVAFDSAVFIERVQPGNVRSLEPADRLSPGDRVVTVVTWSRINGGGGFTVTNPVPRDIAFQDSAREDAQVSADGGRTWGKLGMLRHGDRFATPEDVTHIRWRVSARRAASGRGNIAYSGIVR